VTQAVAAGMDSTDFAWADDGAAIQRQVFPYRRSEDQDRSAEAGPARHRVVVVGAGPVGLSLAIDLAQRGQRVLLLDNDQRLSTGSRAICFAKRTLEIWDRLGVGDAMVAKGVGWNRGRVFFGRDEVYPFDLLPEPGHERPAFINLQQYYAEAWLLRRALQMPGIEIRWCNTVAALVPRPDGARLGVDTPEGRYDIDAEWVLACDGSRSPLRGLLGLETQGQVFRDRFLIADVRIAEADFPAERWFWFDPPFHPGQSVLLHRQPDGVWRIDFQLGWDADPEAEKRPEAVAPRVAAMLKAALGREVPFELEWASVYTFACQRMARFRHGRVLFAGDSAHGVSPFGARGANSGVQDADNLAWKVDAVLRGRAGDALIDSYAAERESAADENILNSTRSTDFITPKSEVSRLFRDAVLDLARQHPFARRLVNSGRLSLPSTHVDSPLNTPDAVGERLTGAMRPGAPAVDAPLPGGGWLLRSLSARGFTLLVFGDAAAADALRDGLPEGVEVLLLPTEGVASQRWDAQPGTAYLLRPDQHVCARWRRPTAAAVQAALARALAQDTSR
jgi:3-(3-hydroxy-phenyl)propionate hydroxylase